MIALLSYKKYNYLKKIVAIKLVSFNYIMF